MTARICARAALRVLQSRAFVLSVSVAGVIACLNVTAAIAIFRASHHEATAWPGESFSFWPERDWQQMEQRFRLMTPSGRVEVRPLGEVSYRQGTFPVHLVRIPALRPGPGTRRVLLVSGIHGTETAGVEALLQLSESIVRSPSRFPEISFDIVPLANPWGWVYGYRYDGEGEDVNRDFASRRTQEARFIEDLMRRDGPFDLVMDLHESKKSGYFIYQYVPRDEGLGREYVKILAGLGLPRENSYREWIFRARDGILETPAAALPWIAMGRSLSLEQYARMNGVRDSYTVETALWDDFDRRVAVHLRTVQTFVTRLSAGQAGR